MSIITFTTNTISGALNKANSTDEISIGRGNKAKVIMTGYIGAPREKDENGEYRSTAFGRLPVQAAIAGEGDKQRYVLDIAGGLRGVLFRNPKSGENSPDYVGNIELSNAEEMTLYGRKVSTQNGDFISLSSSEAKPKPNGNSNGSQSAPASDDGFNSSDIPF